MKDRYLYIKDGSKIMSFEKSKSKISLGVKDKVPIYKINDVIYPKSNEVSKAEIWSMLNVGMTVSVPYTEDRLVLSEVTEIKLKYRVIAVKGVGLVEYEDIEAIYLNGDRIPLY